MAQHGAGLALHPAQGSTTNWPRNWESDPRLTLSTLPATALGASPPTLGKSSRQREGLVRGQGRDGEEGVSTLAPPTPRALPGPCRLPSGATSCERPSGPPRVGHTLGHSREHTAPCQGSGPKAASPSDLSATDRQQGSCHMTPPSAIPRGTVCGLCLFYVGLRNSLSISRGQKKKKDRKDSFRTGENIVKLTFQHHKV